LISLDNPAFLRELAHTPELAVGTKTKVLENLSLGAH